MADILQNYLLLQACHIPNICKASISFVILYLFWSEDVEHGKLSLVVVLFFPLLPFVCFGTSGIRKRGGEIFITKKKRFHSPFLLTQRLKFPKCHQAFGILE